MTPEKERLLKAIENTKGLPEGWTIDVSLDNQLQRAYLEDPYGELVECDDIYDDFAELPEQIENCIAYAKAHNDYYPEEVQDDAD